MSVHANSTRWMPGHLLTDGDQDCRWAPEAFLANYEYSTTLECMRYWQVVQITDDAIHAAMGQGSNAKPKYINNPRRSN